MVGRGEIEQCYKDHRIEVSVWLEGDAWFVYLFYCHEEATNILVIRCL
jgi:hypothetical protein